MRAPRKIEAAPAQETAPDAPAPAQKQGVGNRGRNPHLEVVLGARIRAARIAARISQAALGEAVGVSFQQVQKYELGRDRVAASTLQGFAKALGVHPGTFYGDEMPAPFGSIPDVKAVVRIAERIRCIRNPLVVRRLMALVDVLADTEGDEEVEQPASDETP